MQLGQILSSSPGEACATKPVELHVMQMTAGGRRRHRVRAVLLPVSEADRAAAKRDAQSYLRTLPAYAEKDGIAPPIPPAVLEQEAVYKFLCAALHDADDPLCKLVGAQDYHNFRSGLVLEQVLWLKGVYDRFIDEEYPEIGAPDLKDLEEQAKKK